MLIHPLLFRELKMAYMNKETKHSMADDASHEDCVELAEELLEDVTNKNYPQHVIDLISGIVGELKEYTREEYDEEGNKMVDEEDMSDDELRDAAHKEMAGEKPALMIRIKSKE